MYYERHHRREYKVGRISEEERQKRLEEMKSNAQQREIARSSTLHHARKRDEREEQDVRERSERYKPKAFAHSTANALYSGGARSLEDSVMSRRHYSQRGRTSDRNV